MVNFYKVQITNWMYLDCFFWTCCYRDAAPSGDSPDLPQCEQLLDCTWSEQVKGSVADQYEPPSQNLPVEPGVEATEFTVSTIESEKRKISVKRDNKPKVEGSVAIEMSAQPLLELTPVTGSTFSLQSHCCKTFCVSMWILISEATWMFFFLFRKWWWLMLFFVIAVHLELKMFPSLSGL